MSLVEDARRLAASRPIEEAWCAVCKSDPCLPDCLWMSMPRIVAALEAAERVVRIHDEHSRVVWDSPVFHEIDVLGDTLRGEAYTLEAPLP